MSRLDPWTELEFAAAAALRGQASAAGAALAAERPGFLANESSLSYPQRAHARALNALKHLCLGWRDAPEDARPQIEACVAALLAALSSWQPEDRAPLRSTPRAERWRPALPKPYWLERD